MESERPVRPGMTLADLNAANRRTWDGVTMSPALGAKDALSPQEKERYEQLLRRYEGTGFALSDKEMGEFRQLHRKAVGDSAKDAEPDKHLFVTIEKGVVKWRTSMGQTGSDPAATPAAAQEIIRKLTKRWELTPRQVEVRNDSIT